MTKKERESKIEYFSRFFEKNRNKSSEIWKGIKVLIQMKSTSKQSTKSEKETKRDIQKKINGK